MESKQPLLESDLSSIDDFEAVSSRHWEKPRSRSWSLWSLLLHGSLLLAYSAGFLLWARKSSSDTCVQRDLIYSPARQALEYEKKVFYSPVDGNPFAGPPRPELDEAWHKLLKNIHIRVSKEDIEKMGGRTLELSDGSGFAGSLEVYHDLHCLKRIRRFIYQDTYLPNMTTEQRDFELFHTEHCLEHLREVVMCRGDISLTTFLYRRHVPTAKLLAEHECINWQKLDDWASERAIDFSIPGIVLPEEQSETFEHGLPDGM